MHCYYYTCTLYYTQIQKHIHVMSLKQLNVAKLRFGKESLRDYYVAVC